jgi:outer membrane receptor protein involved in Fe transport
MSARRLSFSLVALLLVQALTLPALFAQATTSTVKGRVVDTDGGGLPGVVVLIKSKNQPSGNKQVVTDIEGNYRIPLLPPANDYTIRVDYPGFAPLEVGPLDLDAGKTVVQDMTLRSDAETTETIVVESQGNIVDTESTKTSTSYNAEFIEGLPIIGHNYQDILTLAPGVTDTDGDGNPNVHGSRDTGLQYRLDGGNITDPVSGTFGANLNSDIIEEVEVITSGASAEYGRADGGFANIITKSGGNDFEGKFSIFWQGKFLDGDGADNNDQVVDANGKFDNDFPTFKDIRPSLSLGGALLKDKLWYFGTSQLLDTERPVNQIGSNFLITSRGNYSFGKLTWQVNSYNKLAFQATGDPRTFEGLFLGPGVSPDSDARFQQGSITPQIKWTSTISPQLLLESTVTSFNSRIQIDPVSELFEPTEIARVLATGSNVVQALYPCATNNCRNDPWLYKQNLRTNQVTGPFWIKSDQQATRNSIKTDLSYTIEDALGQHSVKSGIEFADEKYDDHPIWNPLLVDNTQPRLQQGSDTGGTGDATAVTGFQVLQTRFPLETPQSAASFNSGVYILDAWKPRPNLTVNFGLRLDREDIDSSGFGFFEPRDERRSAVALWKEICQAASDLDAATDDYGLSATQNCQQFNPAEFDGKTPQLGSTATRSEVLPLNHPAAPVALSSKIRALDLNGDGFVEKSGDEGKAMSSDFTTFFERETSNFAIVNNNLSPRLSLSWDPWADGKTKAFGTWGRFYDRLFLSTVAQEIGPDRVNYTFLPIDGQIRGGLNPTLSRSASTTSITQTDRNLRTPYTDEITIGFEREIAPEWSASVTYIRRKGWDLLQDTDLNHITCAEQSLVGVRPEAICGGLEGQLEVDKFGDVAGGFAGNPDAGATGGDEGFNAAGGGTNVSNGAPDLYTVNPNFNEVLRVTNANSSQYEAVELKIVKRLHRNWQMQASYTWSEAFGQAESFQSGLGNDPETRDDEEGFLSFDQRHIVKFQAVTKLPHEITLGGLVQWASGTPFSVVRTIVDLDSTGNTIFRTFFPTSQRNDQRNEGFWQVDSRLEKNFTIGKVQASGFLSVQNLLNSDHLTIEEFNQTAFDGIGLDAFRDFGRRFELGATFKFQ